MGSHAGLTVVDRPRSKKTSDIKIPPLKRRAYYEWSIPPTSISAGQSKGVNFIAVAFENGELYSFVCCFSAFCSILKCP